MRDAEVKLIAIAAIVLAGAMYLRAKKGTTSQPAGTYWDGYGWMKPGVGYEVTWG